MKKFYVGNYYMQAAEIKRKFLVHHPFKVKINPRVMQASHRTCTRHTVGEKCGAES
jgi:hypothetical protein